MENINIDEGTERKHALSDDTVEARALEMQGLAALADALLACV